LVCGGDENHFLFAGKEFGCCLAESTKTENSDAEGEGLCVHNVFSGFDNFDNG
jgi:hypothetical protein